MVGQVERIALVLGFPPSGAEEGGLRGFALVPQTTPRFLLKKGFEGSCARPLITPFPVVLQGVLKGVALVFQTTPDQHTRGNCARPLAFSPTPCIVRSNWWLSVTLE
jgi:hypothetical protein